MSRMARPDLSREAVLVSAISDSLPRTGRASRAEGALRRPGTCVTISGNGERGLTAPASAGSLNSASRRTSMAEPATLRTLSDEGSWPAPGEWTYEDYLRLPDDGNRYEVIRGFLYVTAAPYPMHQYVLSRLHLLMGGFIMEKGLGVLLGAPMDVLLPRRI